MTTYVDAVIICVSDALYFQIFCLNLEGANYILPKSWLARVIHENYVINLLSGQVSHYIRDCMTTYVDTVIICVSDALYFQIFCPKVGGCVLYTRTVQLTFFWAHASLYSRLHDQKPVISTFQTNVWLHCGEIPIAQAGCDTKLIFKQGFNTFWI